MKNREDISGNRYGRLVAISYHHFSAKQRQTFWLCQCDCGRKVIVGKSHLKDGHTKSCGCLQREVSSKVTSARNYKHGHTNERLYKIWTSIKTRCHNERSKGFCDYGGRGIKMCDEWNDYESFRTWAFANGYDELAERGVTTIDRIDVNGNYCPENCRFISIAEQNRNKRTVRKFEYNGNIYTIPGFANKIGMSRSALYDRFYRGNWDVDKVIKKLKLDNLIK